MVTLKDVPLYQRCNTSTASVSERGISSLIRAPSPAPFRLIAESMGGKLAVKVMGSGIHTIAKSPHPSAERPGVSYTSSRYYPAIIPRISASCQALIRSMRGHVVKCHNSAGIGSPTGGVTCSA